MYALKQNHYTMRYHICIPIIRNWPTIPIRSVSALASWKAVFHKVQVLVNLFAITMTPLTHRLLF